MNYCENKYATKMLVLLKTFPIEKKKINVWSYCLQVLGDLKYIPEGTWDWDILIHDFEGDVSHQQYDSGMFLIFIVIFYFKWIIFIYGF